jgi:oxalate decarboxylase/phosphoglucose isomerase-like protein (cupin superfamily)
MFQTIFVNSQVPSGENERIVGYEDPHVHQVFWFKLRKGDLVYVPKIDKYFSLYKID